MCELMLLDPLVCGDVAGAASAAVTTERRSGGGVLSPRGAAGVDIGSRVCDFLDEPDGAMFPRGRLIAARLGAPALS